MLCTILVHFMQVLNLLLYQLTHKAVDEGLMEFLRVDEHLVDIGDDLVDYEVTFSLIRLYFFCLYAAPSPILLCSDS